MTPKEKAKELFSKMLDEQRYSEDTYNAKQCALIAVDEILNQFIWSPSSGSSYWQEVKQEIEKL